MIEHNIEQICKVYGVESYNDLALIGKYTGNSIEKALIENGYSMKEALEYFKNK